MTKVLFLINNLANGGAEKVLVNLVNNMDSNKYKITLRTLVDYGANKDDLLSSIKYQYVFKNSFRGLNYLHLLPRKYIYNKVAYGDFDIIIVYLHGVLTKIISYAPEGQKSVAYLHANMENSPFIKSFKNKSKIIAFFSTYDAIISVSEDVKKSFQRVIGISDRLEVIYNTFDVEGITTSSKEAIKDNIINSKIINICSVGKLESVKGYDRLLRVIKKLIEEKFCLKLIIVGEGSQRRELELYINENKLENHVILAGYDKNPYKYIYNSDLFVCSSHSEGFSSVVVESIILGVPVITTRCPGMSEILGENNEYGIIVDNNEENLYLGLRDLIVNKPKLQYYRQKAKERSTFFDVDKSVMDVEEMIDRVIK